MSKIVNYVLIAEGLTGDSELLFFKTANEAETKFKELTEPLLAVCRVNSLEEHDVFTPDGDGEDVTRGWRFNYGEDDDLDELLNETNRYIKWDTVTVPNDVVLYFAEFSEHVDESSVQFLTKQDGEEMYNDRIDEALTIAKEHKGYNINRYDTSTWQDTDSCTLFQEAIGKPYGECFFGYDVDCYFTYRCGAIGENS